MDTSTDHGPAVQGETSPRPVLSARRDAVVNVLLALLSGGMAALTFPPYELWPLAWVALVPLFIALRRTTAERFGGYLALLFGVALCAGALRWMWDIFHLGVVGIFILISLPWLLFGMAYRVLAARAPAWALILMVPVFWTAVEWIRCEWWYFKFSWLQLGTTLVPWGLGRSWYPEIGVYGVTFLIVLVNVVLAILIMSRYRVILALCIAVCCLIVVKGWIDSRRWISPVPAVKYGSPSPHAVIVQDETGGIDTLKALTRSAVKPETRLVVWPEYALPAYPLDDKHMLAELQQVAKEAHSTLVLGTKEHAPADAPCDWLRRRGMLAAEGGLFFNTALVLSPEGEVLGKYYKTHPIQFFSDGVPGQSYQPIASPVGKLGIAICYDFDYAETALNLVHNGAELLVVPTLDAISWGPVQHAQHTRIAQARAAEVSRWTARATSSGLSQIIDDHGQVHASIPCSASAAISGLIVPSRDITPYVRYTWRLPYFCLVVSLLWLLGLLVATARQKSGEKET